MAQGMGGSIQPASRQAWGASWPLWLFIALLGCLLSACSNNSSVAHTARRVSGPVLQTVHLKQQPFVMVADAPTGRIVVLSTNNPYATDYNLLVTSIQVLDATTGTLVRTVPVSGYVPFVTPTGTTTFAVDPRGGQVFLASAQHVDSSGSLVGHGALRVIDGRTGHIVRTVALPYVPCALVLDASAGRIFVGLGGLSGVPATVAMLDERTGTLLRITPVHGAPCLPGVDERRGTVYFASLDPTVQQVLALDVRTGRVRTTIAVTGEGTIDSLAIDESAGRVLVDQFDGQSRRGNLSIFDAPTGRHVATVDGVGGEPLVVDAGKGRAYAVKRAVSTSNADDIVINTVATRTGQLVRQVEVAPAAENGAGAALTVDALRRHVLAVPAHGDARLHVLDAGSGRQLRTVALGGTIGTPAIVVDERTARIFVANAEASVVDVLDAARL